MEGSNESGTPHSTDVSINWYKSFKEVICSPRAIKNVLGERSENLGGLGRIYFMCTI